MSDNHDTDRTRCAEDLAERLLEARKLRESARGDKRLAARRLILREWQAARLARTHAQLLASPRYCRAAEFFLSDLYGATDFSGRDADLAKILPLMTSMLPLSGLRTVLLAAEVDALSERLDAAMVAALGAKLEKGIGDADYAAAYRKVGCRAERERQLDLIEATGEALDALSRKPFLRATLRMMHGPAHLAGLGSLHDFLARGFEAFHAMGRADEFLDSIIGRERVILKALFAAEEIPFAVCPPNRSP